MGTFSKAAGLSGGYLAASRTWIDFLINRARAFIYSTAPPPALAHATIASIKRIRSIDGIDRRKRLFENIHLLSPGHGSAIVPIVLGSNEAALTASRRLEEEGYLVPAIRFPTVPRGTARLRVSVSAAHEPGIVERLAHSL